MCGLAPAKCATKALPPTRLCHSCQNLSALVHHLTGLPSSLLSEATQSPNIHNTGTMYTLPRQQMQHHSFYEYLHREFTFRNTFNKTILIINCSYRAQIFFCKTKTQCMCTHYSHTHTHTHIYLYMHLYNLWSQEWLP